MAVWRGGIVGKMRTRINYLNCKCVVDNKHYLVQQGVWTRDGSEYKLCIPNMSTWHKSM
jgi:hypothetical protein